MYLLNNWFLFISYPKSSGFVQNYETSYKTTGTELVILTHRNNLIKFRYSEAIPHVNIKDICKIWIYTFSLYNT